MKLDIYIISIFGLYTGRTREAATLQSSAEQQIGIIYEKKKCSISFSYFQLNQIEGKAVQINPGKKKKRKKKDTELGLKSPEMKSCICFIPFCVSLGGFFTPVENAKKAKKTLNKTQEIEKLNFYLKYYENI